MSENLTKDEQLAAFELTLGIVSENVTTTSAAANQHAIINENREANLIKMQFLEALNANNGIKRQQSQKIKCNCDLRTS